MQENRYRSDLYSEEKKGNGLRQKKEQSQAKRLYEIKSSAHEIAVERYIAAAAASIKCIEYDRIENTI